MDRCRCWPGGQENCQSEGSLVSTHMPICSLKDLKSRPGTRRVFRHLSSRLSTSTPTFLHQILLWVLSCGLILESYSTLQLSLPFLRNKNQPHHQLFPVCGQTSAGTSPRLLQLVSTISPWDLTHMQSNSHAFGILKAVDEQNMPGHSKSTLLMAVPVSPVCGYQQ